MGRWWDWNLCHHAVHRGEPELQKFTVYQRRGGEVGSMKKMTALQNLIANSNKTDRASMLDEAIEYLKHLQLQVQMLTMRNGLNLHSMGLPGILHPIQLPFPTMNFAEENESSHISMTNPLQEASSQGLPFMPVVPNITGLSTSFGMESSVVPARFGYQLHPSSKEIGREDGLPHHNQMSIILKRIYQQQFHYPSMA